MNETEDDLLHYKPSTPIGKRDIAWRLTFNSNCGSGVAPKKEEEMAVMPFNSHSARVGRCP